MRIEGGVATYYLQDAMGSVVGMAGSSGSLSGSIKYDGFGNVTSSGGVGAGIDPNIGFDFRLHGMALDAGTGLYFVRARTYDSKTGRFLTRDPVAGMTGRPESMNPYVFAHSNPNLWRDPSGRFIEFLTGIVETIVNVLSSIALPSVWRGPSMSVVAYDPRPEAGCDPWSLEDCNAGRVTDYTYARNPFRYAIAVVSVEDLSDQLEGLVRQGSRRVSHLTVMDHGWMLMDGDLLVGSRIEVGSDVVSKQEFSKFADAFQRIGKQFEHDGLVTFANCHAGADPELLQLLANALGVEVEGGTGKTMPHTGWNWGEWVSCEPN